MKNLIVIFLFTIIHLNIFGQSNPTKKAQPIVEEGKKLYKSEMASWYGTDLFLEAYKDRAKIGGYFSYSEKEVSKCIFYSKKESPNVIGTITFDSTFAIKNATLDLEERDFISLEKDLYEIRKKAAIAIRTDTLFKTYENTNLNLIPLINGKQKKVYILTGPKVSDVVIFGNDYLITFDKNNEIKSKKALHKNIIPIYYGEEHNDGKQAIGAMHSHLPETGDFMTATDICTLMLYSKFTDWKTHNVVSKKYLNIWNCEKNILTVIPMDTIRKIDEHEEKSKKKKKRKRKRKKKGN